MCGRYRLTSKELAIAQATGAVTFVEFSQLKIPFPGNHFRPSDQVPIVRMEDGKQISDLARWGFAPEWASGRMADPSINARGETVATSPKFRQAFRTSRCLLPSDGFYEPRGPKTLKKREQFYFHQPDDGIFAMAGIYTKTESRITCALITTTPNQLMAPIHDRMPVILKPADYAKWLDPLTPLRELQNLMRPAPDADFTFEPEQPARPKQPGLFD